MPKTKLNVIENGMKNQEIIDILEEHGIEVDTTPIIIDMVDTEEGNYVALFLMAEVSLKSSGTKLTRAQLRLKGWESFTTILRAVESVSVEVAESYSIGDKLEDMSFRVVDKSGEVGFWDTQTPRINKEGELLLDKDGNEVFRMATIIDNDELEEIGHDIIEVKAFVEDDEAKDEESDAKETAKNKRGTTSKAKPVRRKQLTS